MRIEDWQAFHDSLTIKPMSPVGPWRPDDSEIAEFERSQGIVLPTSFKEYIKVFGPGRIAIMIEISAPGYPGQAHFDLARRNQMREDSAGWSAADRLVLDRLVYFGTISDENALAWDPEMATRSKGHLEYPIIEVSVDQTLNRLGDSFREFLESQCEERFAKDDDPELAEIGPWRSFAPAPAPPKPAKGAKKKKK